jgi:acetyl-CoA carboxylase biotin carboxylase subunit
MFRRVLVANRGEVAARVIRTCNAMGIESVAVASDADRDLSYLQEADEVVEIGGVRAYLDVPRLVRAGVDTGCSAVHPGWGFLSESPTFAACSEAARLTFVGPRPGTMRRMADKVQARACMAALGLPPIPGSKRTVASVADATREAQKVGYPVLLKALAGGGGRGMRAVATAAELKTAFETASAEAAGAFGDGSLYLEKLVEGGRHVEFQVLGDGRQLEVLGARECSIQRRHQKLLEETPATSVSRKQISEAAGRIHEACLALQYRGVGTVEMLQDGDGRLWFMEMNTRLQVEHTVTEAVTGLDLVACQFGVAANQPLGMVMDAQRPTTAPGGHAIQCRINAEDPQQDFRPSPGKVERLVWPDGPGVRIDTHLREGDRISPHYDSMVAKIIVHASTRTKAIANMKRALKAIQVDGVCTTIPLQLAILGHPEFVSGTYDTGTLSRDLEQLIS